jgi:hypothetical protein
MAKMFFGRPCPGDFEVGRQKDTGLRRCRVAATSGVPNKTEMLAWSSLAAPTAPAIAKDFQLNGLFD